MEKAIKNKVAKAVVPAIDVMFQALRFGIFIAIFTIGVFFYRFYRIIIFMLVVNLEQKLCPQKDF